MAKILISALGTGRLEKNNVSSREYAKTTYRFLNSKVEYNTPFVAAALCEHIKADRLYLVGTQKSMWEEVYNYFSSASYQHLNHDYWMSLVEKTTSTSICNDDLRHVNEAIDGYLKFLRSSAAGDSKCYIIKYGLDEQEMWENFDIFMHIGEQLGEEDEVYLDITHSFRSIPLFIYLMLDLITILRFKNSFKLAGLYYGMHDAINEFGYAPIIDLSPLYNITLWARGAYNFINFGNGYLLTNLINDTNISEKIKNISDLANINYIDDFKREVDSFDYFLKTSSETSEPVVKYMHPYLYSFIKKFKGISSSGKLQFSLAEWHFNNHRFAHGYICLAESIITRILEIYREKDSTIKWGESSRKKVKSLMHNYEFKNNPEFRKLACEYETIRIIRNTIAHAGYSEDVTGRVKVNFRRDVNEAYNHLRNIEKHVFENAALKRIPDLFPFA